MPLTVVQLLPALEAGGVERSTLEIAQALVSAGHRAVVVSAGGRLVPRLERCGAEHVTLDIGRKSLRTLASVAPLRHVLAQADIVHARSRLPAWLGRIALRGLPNRPHWVTTVHGLNSPSRYSAVMASGERVICVSDTVRAHVLRHYPECDPARIRVIERGIDPTVFARVPGPTREHRAWAASLHPALQGAGPLLLLAGRGTRLKGHADALQLLADLRGAGIDARLWLAGADDPARARYIAELHGLAQALAVGDAVAITPPTDAMPRAIAASDLVLQTSRKPEAFGRTVVEALAVGRPVLGWAHGGVGELLARLQPEGAVRPFDREAFAATARRLLAAPPLPPATIPQTLAAMQEATLAVYAELAGR